MLFHFPNLSVFYICTWACLSLIGIDTINLVAHPPPPPPPPPRPILFSVLCLLLCVCVCVHLAWSHFHPKYSYACTCTHNSRVPAKIFLSYKGGIEFGQGALIFLCAHTYTKNTHTHLYIHIHAHIHEHTSLHTCTHTHTPLTFPSELAVIFCPVCLYVLRNFGLPCDPTWYNP